MISLMVRMLWRNAVQHAPALKGEQVNVQYPYGIGATARITNVQGERLFNERGCGGCHVVKSDESGVSPRVPHLAGIGSKVTPRWPWA